MAKPAATDLPYTPYGLLTNDQKTLLVETGRMAYGGDLEYYYDGKWVGCDWPLYDEGFDGNTTYRVVQPVEHNVVDGDVLITYQRVKDEIRNLTAEVRLPKKVG